MLEELFGREENSVQITPPHLPAIDANALGTISSVVSTPSAPTKDDRKRRRRSGRQAAVGKGRRRRMVWAATATAAAVLGLLGLLAGGFLRQGSSDVNSVGPAAMQTQLVYPSR